MTDSIHLYRRRFIPDELISLHNDKILLYTPSLLITRWDTIKPRSDMACGISAYFFEKNCKVTKILDHRKELVFWYCDIMQMEQEPDTEAGGTRLTMVDLLIDIVVEPDGSVRVVDLDEAAEAAERGLITPAQLSLSLRAADNLLKDIYRHRFSEYQHVVEEHLQL